MITSSSEQTSEHRRWLGWLCIPAFLFLPMLWLDHAKFYGMTDMMFYANMLYFTGEALRSGHWLPRWIGEANSGLGVAVPVFYPTLAYSITTLINLPLSLLHLDRFQQLLIGIYVSQVMSGYFCYRWLRTRFAPLIAYSGSQLYVLLPFKLVYLYLNANLAQLWAMAMLPLWMIAAQRLAERKRHGTVLYALLFACVYYMHSLTLIAFGTIPALYVLWFGRRHWLHVYPRLIAANILGLGLCLMQMLPQYYYQHWINMAGFLTGIFSWRENLKHIDTMLCAYYGVVALLVGYAITQIPALRKNIRGAEGWFWVAVIVFLAFMTEPASAFIWERIPLLQYLQFPAVRLHAGTLVAVIYLICLWLSNYDAMRKLSDWAHRKETLAILIGIFGAATYLHILTVFEDPARFDYNVSRETNLVIQQEYITSWGCHNGFDTISDYENHVTTPQTSLITGNADITVEQWQPDDAIRLRINVTSDKATVDVRQCYIPKWHASDAAGRELGIIPGQTGLVELSLPRGTHVIALYQQPTELETRSRNASILFFLLCVIIVLYGWRRSKILLEPPVKSA